MIKEALKEMLQQSEPKEFLRQVRSVAFEVADEWHGRKDTDDLYRLAVGLAEIEKAWK